MSTDSLMLLSFRGGYSFTSRGMWAGLRALLLLNKIKQKGLRPGHKRYCAVILSRALSLRLIALGKPAAMYVLEKVVNLSVFQYSTCINGAVGGNSTYLPAMAVVRMR